MQNYRTKLCGELRASDAGQTVVLSGWIQTKRDHGNLLFVDLRDNNGLKISPAGYLKNAN